jgi:hypothetical protein
MCFTISLVRSKVQPIDRARSIAESLPEGETETAVSTDMPGRASKAFTSRALKRKRTVKRRTILVKLPVALSGGISANAVPEAGEIDSTYPHSGVCGCASTLIRAGSPGFIWVILVLR